MFDYKNFLKTVPNRPGSYRMYSDEDQVIYVGKAKDLKKRLSSYFLKDVTYKTRVLVSHIHHIEFTVTFSDAEALILENNLIKKYQPRYNILLRDDKSYPYIVLSKSKHPGIYFYRGKKQKEFEYFGPYPDTSAAKESLKLLQNLFPIRQCKDSVYANRSRPCLMAQIGKCLAPCMPMTQEANDYYQEQVNLVRLFLKGQNREVLDNITKRMEMHAQKLEFEMAAKLRDQLLALRRVQESQSVSGDLMFDLDVVAHDKAQGICSNHVLFIRKGRIIGTRTYFTNYNQNDTDDDPFNAFICQFYLSENRVGMYPKEIIIDSQIKDATVICDAIKELHKQDISILVNVRSERAKYLKLAYENAKASLIAKLSDKNTAKKRIESLEAILKLSGIEHMECYDISHTQGELTVASCVNFNRDGPDSQYYRKFNIEGITPGDDFAAMHQVLVRRFKDPTKGRIPELIFIDGGAGQLKQAEEVIKDIFSKYPSVKAPHIVAVAKGEGRKAGLETLIEGYTRKEFHLTLDDPALQLVLHIRDESHRFAINAHRLRRQKARTHSRLEDIEGIGPKRRQALLKHLGGRQEVMNASIDELKKVPGISEQLAIDIYESLHSLD